MAAFTTSLYFKALTFLILGLKTLASSPPDSLFSFSDLEKDPKFVSNVDLYGNAKVVPGSSGIHLSGSDDDSLPGMVLYKNPIKLVEGKPMKLVSFSTYFAFSIPITNEGGLAFLLSPKVNYQSDADNNNVSHPSIGVEFNGLKGSKNGEYSYNVAVDVFSSAPNIISNSSINLAVTKKLHAWIDYEANSRRLEVRLSQNGNSRPIDPMLWLSIDLPSVLKEEEMYVGFGPVTFNASKGYCFIYSWSFVLRHFPQSMHSEPLDPKVLVKDSESETSPIVKEKSDCLLKVLAAMIFGTGCGALTAFTVLYLWTIFGSRGGSVVPVESVMKPDDFECKTVKIIVENNKSIQDGKNKN